MGATTEISWTTSTFNPWIGCTKVSPGCAHCYAERDMDHRRHRVKWGKGQERSRTSPTYWRQPFAWNREAAKTGERHLVFCASLADWLDDDHVPDAWLTDLLSVISATPHLTWQLLTKRPHRWRDRMEAAVRTNGTDFADAYGPLDVSGDMLASQWLDGDYPPNVWLGTTTEDHDRFAERAGILASIPANVRFLSAEPLLGPIGLTMAGSATLNAIDWVICGGESGPNARPMNVAWAEGLLASARMWGMRFFMKQMGGRMDPRKALEDLPENLRVREFPEDCGTRGARP